MASRDKDPEIKPVQSERQDYVYGAPPGARDFRRIARIVALVVLVVFAVLFFLLNRDSVEVSLVVTTVTIPLVWILIGTFLMGALAMYLFQYLRGRAVRKARKT
jgi:uncharacterized integral membrane protein